MSSGKSFSPSTSVSDCAPAGGAEPGPDKADRCFPVHDLHSSSWFTTETFTAERVQVQRHGSGPRRGSELKGSGSQSLSLNPGQSEDAEDVSEGSAAHPVMLVQCLVRTSLLPSCCRAGGPANHSTVYG